MNKPLRCVMLAVLSCVFFAPLSAAADAPQSARKTLSFDPDWRFQRGDAAGAEQAGFDDSKWRKLDVPHDWSIEGPFDQNNTTRGAGGWLPSGIGWYRKHFTLPEGDAAKRVFIEFDGVMANSTVWINGHQLGKRPYGYVPFRYDMTGHLNFGPDKENVIAVKADDSAQPASRWYAGAGIYRHVRLIATDSVHIDTWATFVTTERIKEMGPNAFAIHIRTEVVNQSDKPRTVCVMPEFVAPDGREFISNLSQEKTIPPGQSVDFRLESFERESLLWDLDHPRLYRLKILVAERSADASSTKIDEDSVDFGIRDAQFDAATGFSLNGQKMRLKGVCLHQDAGGLGVAVPQSVWERRFMVMKELGCNAIRAAHNPVSPEFLNAADRVGILVMDEMFDCWLVAKNPADYHLYFREWSAIDTRDVVRHDRNHPSIILYSAGNEIHDTPREEQAKEILRGLVDVFHKNDPTRPVTQALFRPNVSHDYDNGLADLLDVIGTNYRDTEVIKAHQDKPTRKIIGTENKHELAGWLRLRDTPAYSGLFLWTGIDYLGEARTWPSVGAGAGLADVTNRIKPQGYERQGWWGDLPTVHIVRSEGMRRSADWTPQNASGEVSVQVHSTCEQVELVLNGKSLGSKPRNRDDSARTWRVAYEPGTIKAIGKNKGQVVATDELQTAGKAAKIVLTADRKKLTHDWDDVVYVTATVADEKGVLVPSATNLISFKLTGPAALAAVDNGDLSSHDSYQVPQRKALAGQCIAILRATDSKGEIKVVATADGLADGTATIEVVPKP